MSLADKITLLRKKQGWSQIDLADRLDVSRQSVSKWEMGQAVPELDKIIKLSELFDVTTDYLLKDNAADSPPPPEPEQEPEPQPQPEQEPVPVPEAPAKTLKKILIWAAAAIFVLSIVIIIAAVTFNYMPNSATSAVEDTILPTPSPVAQSAPAGGQTVLEAVSTDEVYEGPQMETYTFGEGETAMTGDPVSPGEMAAIAAEYEPFGVTYDAQADQWYYNGEAVRVFTDIMTSNGQPLEAGNFRGVMRSFAGQGTIDIRTVRDYETPDANGNGTLAGIEKYDVTDDAVWEESPAHHEEPAIHHVEQTPDHHSEY